MLHLKTNYRLKQILEDNDYLGHNNATGAINAILTNDRFASTWNFNKGDLKYLVLWKNEYIKNTSITGNINGVKIITYTNKRKSTTERLFNFIVSCFPFRHHY